MISVSLNYEFPNATDSLDVTACIRLELFDKDVPIISGGWQCQIIYNGKQLHRINDWKETNIQNENECELIEIESELESDFKLKRFCLLDNANRTFLACDLVLGDSAVGNNYGAELQYESTFIYSDKLQPTPSGRGNNRDIFFQPIPQLRGAEKPASFRVVPLALSAVKFLRAAKGKIYLCQNCSGLSMFIPLFFDFKLSRFNKTLIWRELTVGENMEKITPDKAVGYRIQIDKDQFLFYRSLTLPANRTLLGHNLIDEICYAKFDPQSGVNPLLTK
ncbi:MAG: hypothetical protein LBC74_14515 [Planctomycetaceae bacterium]|jgi:hypothetical protein|nr:hypothetical protein [Planctomycetaceae bacterium]